MAGVSITGNRYHSGEKSPSRFTLSKNMSRNARELVLLKLYILIAGEVLSIENPPTVPKNPPGVKAEVCHPTFHGPDFRSLGDWIRM
jgi:hypothetical protein